MRSRSGLLQRAIRHPDVFVASVRHHGNRVVARPLRTILTIVVVYGMAVVLSTFATNPEAMRDATQSGASIDAFLPLLPPTEFLLVVAGAAIVGVPIGIVVRGVRRDLHSSRRRRLRRNE